MLTLTTLTVRSVSVAGIRAAVEAETVKVARRIPGLRAEVHAAPYLPRNDNGGPARVEWCATHHNVVTGDCPDAEPGQWCHRGDVEASVVSIVIEGVPTMDGDWSVGGVLSRDAQNVVTSSSIGVDFDGWASGHLMLMGECVHCGTTRRRNTTVLLRHAVTGEVRPVGKNCLDEYTGGAILGELVATLTGLGERFAQASEGVIEREESEAPVVNLVALATRYITLYGFIRSQERGANNQCCTADSVRNAIYWTGAGAAPEIVVRDLTDADREAARADVALILGEDAEGSDYLTNLQAVAGVEWAQTTGRRNKVGLLASLPGAAGRIRERDAERAAAPERVNAWIGEIKTRREFTGVLMVSRMVETDFGTSTLVVIDTPEGAVKVFGTARGIEAFEVGDKITLTGTIVEHGEYQSVKQTRISRIKIAAKG